jgi:mono/diheme cytochrome c family protein
MSRALTSFRSWARLFALGAAALAIAAIGWSVVFPRALAPIASPSPQTFSAEDVARGGGLAQIGGCAGCHTAATGPPYSGGRPIDTPFGVIYSSNITPDFETGLGTWSLEAFRRAMKQGVSRDGRYLYPAFPYDHFTQLSDEDVKRLYAFVMTRAPVMARPPANRLIPPFGLRPLLAGWDLLFLRRRAIADEPSRPGDWNRGRYLTQALAHCGACHSPRNWLGAEDESHAFGGGWSAGWYAPPLNVASPAPQAWTETQLYAYLRTGLSVTHAAAAGPMGEVTRALATAPDADVHAIAVYVASLMPQEPSAAPRMADRAAEAVQADPDAATLFAGACAVCHETGAPMMVQGRPSLALGTPLSESEPRDTIQIILQGLQSPAGRSGPYMPAFAADFDDEQIARLVGYLRARFAGLPPWPGDLKRAVHEARKDTGS